MTATAAAERRRWRSARLHPLGPRLVGQVRRSSTTPLADCPSALIDGEAVVMDADGRSSFQALQARVKGAPATHRLLSRSTCSNSMARI